MLSHSKPSASHPFNDHGNSLPEEGKGVGVDPLVGEGQLARERGLGQPSASSPPPPSLPRTWAQPRRLQPDSPQAAVVWDARAGGGQLQRTRVGTSGLGEQLPSATHPILPELLSSGPIFRGGSPQGPDCSHPCRTSTVGQALNPQTRELVIGPGAKS